jgi:hypothetical protein
MGGIVFALKEVLRNVLVVILIGGLTYLSLIWVLRVLPKEDVTALFNLLKRRTGDKSFMKVSSIEK